MSLGSYSAKRTPEPLRNQMLVTALIIILALSLVGIGYGIRAIARELDGMEGDDAKRRGAEAAERDAEMKKTLEKWREGK